jgi:hypothetical protein
MSVHKTFVVSKVSIWWLYSESSVTAANSYYNNHCKMNYGPYRQCVVSILSVSLNNNLNGKLGVSSIGIRRESGMNPQEKMRRYELLDTVHRSQVDAKCGQRQIYGHCYCHCSETCLYVLLIGRRTLNFTPPELCGQCPEVMSGESYWRSQLCRRKSLFDGEEQVSVRWPSAWNLIQWSSLSWFVNY